MKKVSVIITTHNREKFLKQAVKSVLNQTYSNYECIIVDDASNDENLKYLKKLTNDKIKKIYISREESKGGNYARNKGIENCTGEFIAFLDDDDIWLPTKLERQVEILNSNKNIGLVYCGRIIYVDEKFAFCQLPESEYRGNLNQKVFEKIFCTTSSILTRKTILEECNKFDEKLKFWQEYDLIIRICQKYDVEYVNEPLIIFRNNFKDKNRLSNKYYEWKKSVEYIYAKYEKQIDKLSEEQKNKMKLVYLENAISRCYINHNLKEKKKLLKEVYKINPTKINIVKWIFNFSPQQIIYYKYYFRKFKLFDVSEYIK